MGNQQKAARNGFAEVTEGRNEVEDPRPSPRGINGGDPLGRRPFMPQGAVGACRGAGVDGGERGGTIKKAACKGTACHKTRTGRHRVSPATAAPRPLP